MRLSPLLYGCVALLSVGNAAASLRISEFMASNATTIEDADGDYSDWIEIHNAGAEPVNLAGHHLTDNAASLTRWTFPPVSLAAGARLLVFASGKDRGDPGAELHCDFQLAAAGEYLALVAPDGTTILSEFSPAFPPQFPDQSYGYGTFAAATAQTLVPHGAPARYHVPADASLGSAWTAPAFDDSGWATGVSGFGWESAGGALEPAVATDIAAVMRSINASGYFRFPFTFDGSSSALQSLSLVMQIDDGFVAYLNGVEVARQFAPANPLWNSPSSGSTSDNVIMASPPAFDLAAALPLVTHGGNILAIHGMNAAAGGSDFLVRPRLDAGVVDTSGAVRAGYFDSPSPGTPEGGGTASGPLFVDFTDKPARPEPGSALPVTARPLPINAPTASVTLHYRVQFGPETSLPMADDGTGADASAGDGVFSAVIPAAAYGPGQMVRWRFVATDTLGLTTREPRFPDPADSHEYVGTVVADPSVQSLLPVVETFLANPAAANGTAGTRGAVFYLGELYDNVFMNVHGQSTSGFPKKSYNIDFNRTQRFRWHPAEGRAKDIDLLTNWADKSKVRHVLSWEVMRESGVQAHFAFTVRVQQNSAFFSTADFVEDADEVYLERAGLNPDGALYKIYNNTLNTGNSVTSPAVEKKNRRGENNQDMADFIAGLNTGTLEQQWAFIYDNVNLPMCVNMAAANCVIRNSDMHSKNWYLYRDTGRTDEWGLLPWDLDLAHGRVWNSTDNYFDNALFTNGFVRVGDAVRLVSMMWSRPDTRDMMMRRIRTLSDRFLGLPGPPSPGSYFERRLDEQSALVDPPSIIPSDARLDFEKWGSWVQSSGAQRPYNTVHPDIEDMARGIARFRNEYLPARRAFIYNSGGLPAPQGGQLTFIYSKLVDSGAALRYRVPSDASVDGDWKAPAFDDSPWTAGTTGIGFDSAPTYLPLIGTNVGAEMRNLFPSVYMRIPFQVADPGAFDALKLLVQLDDGFVAYLNGTEIARANAPATPAWNSLATAAAEATPGVFDEHNVSAHLGALVPGQNVLAIHLMNTPIGSGDLLMLPELHAGVVDGSGSLEPLIGFGQIEFKPASNNQDEEFVELVNANPIAVDVSDWMIGGGIAFSIPPGTVIPANRSLFLSPDVKAFRNRATGPTGGQQRFVVGPYGGHLSNLGETLLLSDQTGALNNSTTYTGDPSDAQRYLVVSELMYHPAGNGLAEFIELLNISDSVTLDLTGVRFTAGVDFNFTGSAISSLAPGARVLIVRDLPAFTSVHGDGLPVAGAFSGGTALNNGGETLKLEDAENGTIREFTYDNAPPWPSAAAGSGSSLVLVNPHGAPDHGIAAHWTAATPRPGLPDPTTPVHLLDGDGDGLSALLEQALGTSDSDPTSGRDAYFSGFQDGTATFTYRRNLASGLDVTVQTSANLEHWQDAESAALVELARGDNGDGTETITVAFPTPIPPGETRAFRLLVTAP